MIVEILIAAGIGALVGTALAFFDEIINWGKSLFNKLSKSVKQAWVYVQRIPGGIKRFFRYLDGWDIKETEGSTRTVEWSEVERMYRDHEIDYDTYQNLKSGNSFRLSKYMREVEC